MSSAPAVGARVNPEDVERFRAVFNYYAKDTLLLQAADVGEVGVPS